MNDIKIKTSEVSQHMRHMEAVLTRGHRYDTHINPERRTSGVKAGKFLRFYPTEKGIETNPEKCWVIPKWNPHRRRSGLRS